MTHIQRCIWPQHPGGVCSQQCFYLLHRTWCWPRYQRKPRCPGRCCQYQLQRRHCWEPQHLRCKEETSVITERTCIGMFWHYNRVIKNRMALHLQETLRPLKKIVFLNLKFSWDGNLKILFLPAYKTVPDIIILLTDLLWNNPIAYRRPLRRVLPTSRGRQCPTVGLSRIPHDPHWLRCHPQDAELHSHNLQRRLTQVINLQLHTKLLERNQAFNFESGMYYVKPVHIMTS